MGAIRQARENSTIHMRHCDDIMNDEIMNSDEIMSRCDDNQLSDNEW